jgi:hypothetical protein
LHISISKNKANKNNIRANLTQFESLGRCHCIVAKAGGFWGGDGPSFAKVEEDFGAQEFRFLLLLAIQCLLLLPPLHFGAFSLFSCILGLAIFTKPLTMRIVPVEPRLVLRLLFCLALLVFSILPCSFANLQVENNNENVIISDSTSLERNGAQIEALNDQENSPRYLVDQLHLDEDMTPCKDANDKMLTTNPTWKMESNDFETDRLPKCLGEWSREVLPPGVDIFPILECRAPLPWTSACYAAGGMIATVIATADFSEASNSSSSRSLSFPTCFSSAKACTSSRFAADYMWTERLNQISEWCANQTNPYLVCRNVKISTNFWQVANLPKIIRIVVGVVAAVATLGLAIVVILYCRWKRKREHDNAMERTLLLKQARQSIMYHQPGQSPYSIDINTSQSSLDTSSVNTSTESKLVSPQVSPNVDGP